MAPGSVVDPESPRAGQAATRVFFGATVRYATAAGTERVVPRVDLGGRPSSPRMPCGWGCGAKLSATEMRGHFTRCPKRPRRSWNSPPIATIDRKATGIGNAIVINKCSARASVQFKGEQRAKSVSTGAGRTCHEKRHCDSPSRIPSRTQRRPGSAANFCFRRRFALHLRRALRHK